MKAIEKTETITFIAAVLLFMLWGYAAISKVADYDRFVAQMKLAPIPLMQIMGPTLGWSVPLIEFGLMVLLWFDKWRTTGLYLSFFLLLIFEVYITAMLLSGLALPCTCGGLISKLQWREHLVFNAVFMLVALFPMIYQRILYKYNTNEYSPQ